MEKQLELFDTEFSPEDMLRDFIKTFETPNSTDFWITLVMEELAELEEAISLFVNNPTEDNLAEALKEYIDLAYVTTGFRVVGGVALLDIDQETNERIIAAFEVIEGILDERNSSKEHTDMVLEAAFREVHRSNMSKLLEDGSVLRREDGKVLKGPNYSPADIHSVLYG